MCKVNTLVKTPVKVPLKYEITMSNATKTACGYNIFHYYHV